MRLRIGGSASVRRIARNNLARTACTATGVRRAVIPGEENESRRGRRKESKGPHSKVGVAWDVSCRRNLPAEFEQKLAEEESGNGEQHEFYPLVSAVVASRRTYRTARTADDWNVSHKGDNDTPVVTQFQEELLNAQ
jgi:hypothetical protein